METLGRWMLEYEKTVFSWLIGPQPQNNPKSVRLSALRGTVEC
jgi:hypothetical protein